MRSVLLVFSVIPLGLAACGNGDGGGSAEDRALIVERAATLRPDDFALAQTYDRSCRFCHATPESGAPLTGDAADWAPRISQGNQVLIEHTIRGFNGMPPLGMCPDCSPDEFLALIAFMSAEPSE